MATTIPNGSLLPLNATNLDVTEIATEKERSAVKAEVVLRRPRKITQEAGRAIEILGHAIDYLADEFALDCMSPSLRCQSGPNPRMAAIELLMARNREIYLSCPYVPTWGERLRSLGRSLLASQQL